MEGLDALGAAAEAVAAAAPARWQRLTEEQRWSIVSMHKDDRDNAYIARKLGCTRNAVAAVLKRFGTTGTPMSGARSGRPQSTDEALKTAIAAVAHHDKFTSPRRIKRKLELDVSPRTIDRVLQEAGLFGRVAVKKRDYSAAERRARVAFAEGYGAWTAAQWERVIFSDEKTFYGRGFCGRTWVRRPKGEALNPEYTVDRVAHPPKVGLWGCFSASGPGYIRTYNENMDAALMQATLDENLIATVQLHGLDNAQWYFLHDNAATFRNAKVSKWLHDHGITCLEFPPYSPDLNPIENLWSWFTRRLDTKDAASMENLQDLIADEWEKMRESKEALDYMKTLVHSMPDRCAAVTLAEGWHTKW